MNEAYGFGGSVCEHSGSRKVTFAKAEQEDAECHAPTPFPWLHLLVLIRSL